MPVHRVVVAGAAGRMGRAAVRAIARRDDMRLVGALGHTASLGQDAGLVAGAGALGVPIGADLAALLATAHPTVLVDLSRGEPAAAHAEVGARPPRAGRDRCDRSRRGRCRAVARPLPRRARRGAARAELRPRGAADDGVRTAGRAVLPARGDHGTAPRPQARRAVRNGLADGASDRGCARPRPGAGRRRGRDGPGRARRRGGRGAGPQRASAGSRGASGSAVRRARDRRS